MLISTRMAVVVAALALVFGLWSCDLMGDDAAPDDPGAGNDGGPGDVPVELIVPTDYGSIQAAINAAGEGSIVIVMPGTYPENINFKGKDITVRSSDPTNAEVVGTTIIDGGDSGPVVTFAGGEGEDAVLWGFTITNGNAGTSGNAGGILITGASSPLIEGNVIAGNTSYYGGGGFLISNGSSPLIKKNVVTGNSSENDGGGFFISNSLPRIEGNLVMLNTAYNGGGAAVTNQSTVTFEGNTFLQNATTQNVAGLYANGASSVTLSGNVFENHSGEPVRIAEQAVATIIGNTIRGNSAAYPAYRAGGITVIYSSTATISDNEITANTSGGDFRGAVTVSNNSSVEIARNTITGNVGSGRGAIVVSASEATITGNTITGNKAEYTWGAYADGGGITISHSSTATISGNLIADNVAEVEHTDGGGGGILISSSEVIIDDNQILNNRAHRNGGGIYIYGGSVQVTSNTISGNKSESNGGGIYFTYGEATIYDNTIDDNSAQSLGGGIWIWDGWATVYGSNGTAWAKDQCPPGTETGNSYSGNVHHYPDIQYGMDVYFY